MRTTIESWDRLIDRDDHLRDWLFNLRMEIAALDRGDTSDANCLEKSARTGTTVQATKIAAPQPILSAGSRNPKAFISHSTQDHLFVEKFAAELRTNGVDAWFSEWEIKPGDSIRGKIEKGLEDCEYFIIVLSKSSIERPWVQKELDTATVRNIAGRVRKIIPVKIEDCGDLPPTLGSLCWEDFSNQPYHSALRRVLYTIFEIDVKPPIGSPPTTQTSDLAHLQITSLAGGEPTIPELTTVPATKFPVYAEDLAAFARELRSEGFDARTHGSVRQPAGLDGRAEGSGFQANAAG